MPLGRILKIASALVVIFWILNSMTRHGSSPIYPLLAIVLFIAGSYMGRTSSTQKVSPPPTFPSGFNPTYVHDNIALDAAGGRVWLRDQGRSRVFTKREILKWGVETNSMQGLPATYANGVVRGGTTVKYNSRIAIQTTDLDHPVYAISFNRHNDFFFAPKNVADASAWVNRLTAFMHS